MYPYLPLMPVFSEYFTLFHVVTICFKEKCERFLTANFENVISHTVKNPIVLILPSNSWQYYTNKSLTLKNLKKKKYTSRRRMVCQIFSPHIVLLLFLCWLYCKFDGWLMNELRCQYHMSIVITMHE